jgi:hypothetical protein
MRTTHQNPTKRRKGSRRYVALHTESPAPGDVEELYWFAMALTGDPDFAAKLVVDAGNETASGRGIFRTDSAARLPID